MTSAAHLPASALTNWTRRVAQEFGVTPALATEASNEVLLDLVRDIGREVARPAGPLTVFLLGVALADAEYDNPSDETETRISRLRELADRALALAQHAAVPTPADRPGKDTP